MNHKRRKALEAWMAKEIAQDRTVGTTSDRLRAEAALGWPIEPLEHQAVAYAAVRAARKRRREADAKRGGSR